MSSGMRLNALVQERQDWDVQRGVAWPGRGLELEEAGRRGGVREAGQVILRQDCGSGMVVECAKVGMTVASTVGITWEYG